MLPNYVDDHVGDMHFRARQSRSHRLGCEWMAWCAKTPDLGDSALSVPFGMDCWFQYAPTAGMPLPC